MKRNLAMFLIVMLLGGCASLKFEQRREVSQARVRVAQSQLAQDNLQGALLELKKAERENPHDAEVHYFMAETYRRMGKTDKALTHINRAIREAHRLGLERPGLKSDALNTKGAILAEQGETQAAIKAFNQALLDELYTTPEYALFNLGNVYVTLGNKDEALKCFKQALNRNQHYAPAWRAIAMLSYAREDYEGALTALQHAVLEYPGYIEAHLELADLARKLGRWTLARDHYRQVVNLDPANSFGLKAVAEERLAKLYE
jgi:Tfp pilus assembly protein PilF